MSVYKRGQIYWADFYIDGKRHHASTGFKNERKACTYEDALKTEIRMGKVGIQKRKAAPTLRDFGQEFADYIGTRCADKPRTVKFYAEQIEGFILHTNHCARRSWIGLTRL